MTALYVLADEYRNAAAKLADLNIDEQTLTDTLDSLSGELEAKAQNVAFAIRNMETTLQALKDFRAAQEAREKALEFRIERVRNYLQRCVESSGILRIDGPGISLSFKKSTAVVIDAVDLIPERFIVHPEPPPSKPDKRAIGLALKSGLAIDGAHLEERMHLQIKP